MTGKDEKKKIRVVPSLPKEIKKVIASAMKVPEEKSLTELLSKKIEPKKAKPKQKKTKQIEEFKVPVGAYIQMPPEVIIQGIVGKDSLKELENGYNEPEKYVLVGDSPEYQVYMPLTANGRLEIRIDIENNDSSEIMYNAENQNWKGINAKGSRGKWATISLGEEIINQLKNGNGIVIWLHQCKSQYNDKGHLYEVEGDCPPHLKIIIAGQKKKSAE